MFGKLANKLVINIKLHNIIWICRRMLLFCKLHVETSNSFVKKRIERGEDDLAKLKRDFMKKWVAWKLELEDGYPSNYKKITKETL